MNTWHKWHKHPVIHTCTACGYWLVRKKGQLCTPCKGPDKKKLDTEQAVCDTTRPTVKPTRRRT